MAGAAGTSTPTGAGWLAGVAARPASAGTPVALVSWAGTGTEARGGDQTVSWSTSQAGGSMTGATADAMADGVAGGPDKRAVAAMPGDSGGKSGGAACAETPDSGTADNGIPDTGIPAVGSSPGGGSNRSNGSSSRPSAVASGATDTPSRAATSGTWLGATT